MGQNSSSNQPSSSSRGGRDGRGDRLRVAIFFGPSPGQGHGQPGPMEPELCIKFPEIAHASAYCDLVARRKHDADVTRTGRSVYMKLPDSIRRLERRESLGGFVFAFRSSGRAYEWEDDIFRVVDYRDQKRHPTEVVLKERWRPGELNHIFGVHPKGHGDHEGMSMRGANGRSHHGDREKDGHRDRDRDRDRGGRDSPRDTRGEKSSPPPGLGRSRPSSRVSRAA